MTSFFANVPVWVLPLFIGLLAVSLRATRTRTVPKALVYSLPLLGLLSVRTVLSFELQLLALTLFAFGYASGARLGFISQAKWIIDVTRSHVTIRGEWLTMLTVMGLFLLNFVHGAINGIAPDLILSPIYIATISAVAGCLSGTFVGRAVRVMRWTHAPA
jgi:hypothetical protein